MNNLHGLLRVRIIRGMNLAIRDVGSSSSDPYVVITMGQQRLKTRVIKNNCNPEWNEELTLSVSNLNAPINLTVYDKDTFTVDDKMGEAAIDIKPYIVKLRRGTEDFSNGTVVSKVQPSSENSLADESSIVYKNGKLVQYMCLRLKNVECGEVDVQLEWIEVPGCKGLN